MKQLYIYTGTDFGKNSFAADDIESAWENYAETCLTGSAADGGALPTQELHAEFVACFRPWNPDDPDDIKLARDAGLLSAAAELGHKGGLSTSPNKTKASRLNGKLGGRPREQTN